MLKDYFEVPNKPAIKSGNVLSCDFTDHETFIPQPLDFTRNTLATYVDCNGVIKVSGVSDTELVTNGDFATDRNWSKFGGATISGGKGNIIGDGSSFTNLTQANVFVVGKTYEITVDVTINSGLGLKFQDGITNENFGHATVSGVYTFYGVANNTSFVIGRRTGGTPFNSFVNNVSVKEVDLNVPRIDYLTEIGKAKELQKPSLLLEPQSTNKFTRSKNFSSNYWSKSNCTVQQSTITSPDGSQSSYKLIPDAGTGGNRSLGRNFTSLSNLHTFSVFAKKDELRYLFLRLRNAPNEMAVFDLEDGVISATSPSPTQLVADSAKIEDYGNGWFRCSATFDPSQSNTVGQLYPSFSADNTGALTSSFDGDGTSGIYIFGAQLEEKNYVTSYIPTSGSTVTRNVELCDNAGKRGVFNKAEGTIYVEFTELGFTNPNQSSIAVSQEGSSNNRLLLFRGGGSNWSFQVRAAAVNEVSNSVNLTTTETLNKFAKVAIRYKSGEVTAFVNGSQSFTNSSTFAFNSNLFKFGFTPWDGATNNNFYGRVKDVKVFRRTLTDSEMAELTNNIT